MCVISLVNSMLATCNPYPICLGACNLLWAGLGVGVGHAGRAGWVGRGVQSRKKILSK